MSTCWLPPCVVAIAVNTVCEIAAFMSAPHQSSTQSGKNCSCPPLQFKAGQVGGFRIVVWVDDVVAAVARGRNFALGRGLELAVSEHRKAHASVGERAIGVDRVTLRRLRIVGIGMVRGLRALDHVDPRS